MLIVGVDVLLSLPSFCMSRKRPNLRQDLAEPNPPSICRQQISTGNISRIH